MHAPYMSFEERVRRLPRLGLGVSTEYGALTSTHGLDIERLRREHPDYAGFLEVGVEVAKGLDEASMQWAQAGRATTYHFLDVNLDEPEDQDPHWHSQVRALIALLDPAWLCGDAGMWHFGPRARGHMLLLPPVLCDDAAKAMGEGIGTLRDAVHKEVLPENPPGHIFLGDLHLLDFFAKVCDYGDSGMLLDCAHLAIYQRLAGLDALSGLDAFPLERIVEVHVAGGSEHAHDGYAFVEDDHTPDVLPDTWRIFEYIVDRAPNLKAVVFECERNSLEACLPGFERIARTLG